MPGKFSNDLPPVINFIIHLYFHTWMLLLYWHLHDKQMQGVNSMEQKNG